MKSLLLVLQLAMIFISPGAALKEPPPSVVLNESVLSLDQTDSSETIKTIYSDKNFFLTAIKGPNLVLKSGDVTGLTVPHHLLVKDTMADLYYAISDNEYDTIVILSPEHFFAGHTPFSTTSKDFETVFGVLHTNKELVRTIIAQNPLITESDLFKREHGVHAQTPFIKYWFPNAKIIPIASKINTTKEELDSLFQTLSNVLPKEKILIIQSTDFSHYLTQSQADKMDAETMKAIKSGNPEEILNLTQPDHIDSVASQYLQIRLQKEFFKTHTILVNRTNSANFAGHDVNETTSYITYIYVTMDSP